MLTLGRKLGLYEFMMPKVFRPKAGQLFNRVSISFSSVDFLQKAPSIFFSNIFSYEVLYVSPTSFPEQFGFRLKKPVDGCLIWHRTTNQVLAQVISNRFFFGLCPFLSSICLLIVLSRFLLSIFLLVLSRFLLFPAITCQEITKIAVTN